VLVLGLGAPFVGLWPAEAGGRDADRDVPGWAAHHVVSAGRHSLVDLYGVLGVALDAGERASAKIRDQLC
jgi:hypothetical protein